MLAQAVAEAVILAGAEAAAHASGEARLQILMADLPCWRPSGARPRRLSRPAREHWLRRRPLHQGRPLQAGAASFSREACHMGFSTLEAARI